MLDQIASEGRLAAAARSLERQLRGVPKRAAPFVDAVLGWVVKEAAAVRPAGRRALALSAGPLDALLVLGRAGPAYAGALAETSRL